MNLKSSVQPESNLVIQFQTHSTRVTWTRWKMSMEEKFMPQEKFNRTNFVHSKEAAEEGKYKCT